MHFRRAVAEQCTCSCWPSGSRRSVFLAFDDITLGESQPCLEFTREAPVQEATTLLHLGRVDFHDSPPSHRVFSHNALHAICQRLPGSLAASRNLSSFPSTAVHSAIDRYEGDHADLPVGPLALFSVQDAELAGQMLLSSEPRHLATSCASLSVSLWSCPTAACITN